MNIKTTCLFVGLLCYSFSGFSQKENNIWCFGDSAGINFADTANPVTFSSSLDTRGSCVSIADSAGNLLFYANTRAGIANHSTLVWNKNHQLMQYGDSIVGSGWYNELCIVPFPGNPDKYYLFFVGVTSNPGLYYSVIDMSLNGGLGRVVQKNVIIHSLLSWDALAAIKHANGRDWWLISKDRSNGSSGNNLFHVLFSTPSNLSDSIQPIGLNANGGLGSLTFSKDGTKLLFSSYNGLVEVMDFDRCTGLLSNAKTILTNFNTPRISGSAFSPNGEAVYISTSNGNSYLMQFDLNAPNIPNSRDTIASLVLPYEAGGSLRLAPDNKIYWACAWTNGINYNYPYQDTMYHFENMNISVIENPNVLGSGCNLSLYGYNLGGKRVYWGLPNNPNYSLGRIQGSNCDSLFNSTSALNEEENHSVVYPNPFSKSFLIRFPDQSKRNILIYTGSGQLVYSENSNSPEMNISLPALSPGVYLLKLISEKYSEVISVFKIE